MRSFLKRHRFTIWVVVFTAVTVWALVDGDRQRSDLSAANERVRVVSEREAKEDVLEVAQACITGFEVREDIRDAIELATRGAVHTANQGLIRIGTEQGNPPPPGVEERFNEIVAALIADDIARARAGIPDSECDLAGARRIVAGGLDEVSLP